MSTLNHMPIGPTSASSALQILRRFVACHGTPVEPETLRAHGRKHNLNDFEIGMAVSALRSRGWIHITPNGLITSQS